MRWREFRLESERAYWRATLKAAGNCVTTAARMAGVHRAQVYKRLHRCGLPTPDRGRDRVPVDIRNALRRFLS